MPPGAKKRKALKKKQQQQQQQQQQGSIGTSTNNNGDNLHGGNEEHGSQDDRESDGNLSSPGSQGNQEFGGTKDSSAAKEISDVTQGLGQRSGNGTAVDIGTDNKKNTVEKSPVTSYEKGTQTAKNVDPHDLCVNEIAPVVDSVSKVVISEKNEHAETSTHSKLVVEKSGETKEYPTTGLEKENGKLATSPGSAAGTDQKVESVRASEAPLSSEEKRLLLPGPPAVRTSWLSCCGLFDVMTGSDR